MTITYEEVPERPTVASVAMSDDEVLLMGNYGVTKNLSFEREFLTTDPVVKGRKFRTADLASESYNRVNLRFVEQRNVELHIVLFGGVASPFRVTLRRAFINEENHVREVFITSATGYIWHDDFIMLRKSLEGLNQAHPECSGYFQVVDANGNIVAVRNLEKIF